MLITTHNGILVNSQYVALVAIKKCEVKPQILACDEQSLHKVILFLTGGDPIVAADRLTRDAAEFLRKDIARHWTEGSTQLDVPASLARRNDDDENAEDGQNTP